MKHDVERCLKCKKARCQIGCPIHTPIPEVITLYLNNEFEQAGALLFYNNPLSLVCSFVCDHQKQCYGNCILNMKKQPIPFYKLEQDLSRRYLDTLQLQTALKKESIAIIGAGPAGIVSALLLALEGYRVTLFEKMSKIGGMVQYGIPNFRFDKSILMDYQNLLTQLHVDIKLNTEVLHLNELKDNYSAIILSNGLGNSKRLGIKGEHQHHVISAIDYLKDPKRYPMKHKKVIVIGAGNVAMDAARTAKFYGGESYIYYRKTFDEMPASKLEIQEAIHEGVQFELLKAPIEILESSIVFANCMNVKDELGSIKTEIIPHETETVAVDYIIYAISQTLDQNFIDLNSLVINKHILGVDETMMTSIDGIFACGDIITGPKTVVDASNTAKEVVNHVKEYLDKKRKFT